MVMRKDTLIKRFLLLGIFLSVTSIVQTLGQDIIQNSSNIWSVIIGVEDDGVNTVLIDATEEANQIYNFFYNYGLNPIPENQIRRLTKNDANRNNLLNNLEDVCSKMGREDVLFFFYSAHGSKDGFRCSDNWVTYSEINNIFNKSKAKLTVCFAYSCYSGAYNLPDDLSFVLIAAANELAYTYPNFCDILVDGLAGNAVRRNESYVSIEGLFDYTKSKLSKSKYTPVIKYGKFHPNTPLLMVK